MGLIYALSSDKFVVYIINFIHLKNILKIWKSQNLLIPIKLTKIDLSIIKLQFKAYLLLFIYV